MLRWRFGQKHVVMKSVITSCGLLAIIVVAWLTFDFRESVYCRRGSLDFRRGITERVIRDFPIAQAVSSHEPRYHFGCGDGPKPADQSLTYRSQLPPSRLCPQIFKHIMQCGYAPVQGSTNLPCYFTNGGKWLFLSVLSETANVSRIDVELNLDN